MIGPPHLCALVVLLGSAGIAATELPIGEWSKLGVSGMCLFLVWWLIAKTLPQRDATHAASMKELGGKIDDLRVSHERGVERQCSLLSNALETKSK